MLRSGNYIVPTLLAVFLHVVVVALLANSWFEHEEASKKVPRHVQARIVDLTSQKALKKKPQKLRQDKKLSSV